MIETQESFLSKRRKTSLLQRKAETKKSVSFADSFGFSLHDVKMFDRLEDFSQILFDLATFESWKCNFLDYNAQEQCKTQYARVRSVDALAELLNAKTYSCTPLVSPKHQHTKIKSPQPPTTSPAETKELKTDKPPPEVYYVPPLKADPNCAPDTCQPIEVKLESLRHKSTFCLTGTVLVQNICFSKNVSVKITGNSWKTFECIDSSYLNAKCHHLDRFFFDVDLLNFTGDRREVSTLKLPVTLELCVNYSAGKDSLNFWDNNNGENYKLYKVAI